MGKHKFDRKKAVRFTLVPGPEINGKPSVLFKPVQGKKSKLNKKEKKKMISEFSDYDEITINGKAIDDDEIPAYVLEQIRGRKDLLFNELNGNMGDEDEEEGDLYDIQDGLDEDEGEKISYQVEQEKIIKEYEREEDQDSEDEEWSDEDEGDFEEIDEEMPVKKMEEKGEQYQTEEGQFPSLQEVLTVNIEGKQYKLTQKQIDMLDTVLPSNYADLNIGINFQKYDEDGLPLSQKEQNDKYFLKEGDKVGIIDTYQFIPPKAIPVIDTDITPEQLKTDVELREVEDALNYQGQDAAYEEIEDDFFAKMIQGQMQSEPVKEVKKKEEKVVKKHKQEKPKVKEIKKVEPKPEFLDKQLDEELEKAMYNFENNIEDKKDKQMVEDDSQSDDQPTNKSITIMNYAQLDKREEYIGRDGELDWRMLTKKQKKEYMKTKVIKEGYEEMREREIQQKMKGKSNVTPQQLHLKQLVKHIPYEQDHVMKKSLADGLQQNVQDEDEYISFSSQEDDIVSFHEKTSIIATNLSVIEEPHKEKKKKEKKNEDDQSQANISRMKIVNEKRDRKETSEERKERKKKLKEMKKDKREQKKEFAQRFSKIKKETMKGENHTNTLKGVSYVKIY